MTAAFFDGRQAAARPVEAGIRDGAVVIAVPGYGVVETWPLRQLRVRALAADRVTLSRGDGDQRLVVDDPALLAALRTALGRRMATGHGWTVPLLASAVVLAAAVALVVFVPGLLAPLVPRSWEESLGDGAQRLLLSSSRTCGGTAGQQALQRLVDRLAAANGITGPVRVTVSGSGMVNAFTLPGQRVVVMRGLIETAGDGDELAGVVAHELGHVAHRDPTTAMVRQVGLGVLATALGWGGLDPGSLASALLTLSYGRRAETAADAAAIDALRRTGLQADGLARFFQRIETGEHASIPFLSDHPPTADRRALVAQPGGTGEPAFTPGEWQAIRTMCAP